MYRAAVARTPGAAEAGEGDCEQEDNDMLESYRILRRQTLRELDALRAEASEARDR